MFLHINLVQYIVIALMSTLIPFIMYRGIKKDVEHIKWWAQYIAVVIAACIIVGAIVGSDNTYQPAYEEGYKAGQIAVLNGAVEYELRTLSDSSRVWVKKNVEVGHERD